jgi:hypothetical protein
MSKYIAYISSEYSAFKKCHGCLQKSLFTHIKVKKNINSVITQEKFAAGQGAESPFN